MSALLLSIIEMSRIYIPLPLTLTAGSVLELVAVARAAILAGLARTGVESAANKATNAPIVFIMAR
jgi:hypothetical protein